MTNWVETFREYRRWLYWPHCEKTTIELCKWYQNQCRVYLDEYKEREPKIIVGYPISEFIESLKTISSLGVSFKKGR